MVVVVVVVVPFVGGCSWSFVVGVGGWWWCSCRLVGGAGHSSLFVGGAAGCSTLVIRVVIGCQSLLVFDRRLLFIIICHCALFVVWRRFVLHGDMAADVGKGVSASNDLDRWSSDPFFVSSRPSTLLC